MIKSAVNTKSQISETKIEKKLVHSLLDSIKSDRVLTFNNFRYRLLHWCFNVNPKTPEESPLPKMFYTHYCPLFHLTNLIAIFSPLIFVLKICMVSIVIVIKTIEAIVRLVTPVFVWIDCKTTTMSWAARAKAIKRKEELEGERYKLQQAQREQFRVIMQNMTTEEKKQRAGMEAEREMPSLLKRNVNYAHNFDYFWEHCQGHFTFLGKKHAKKCWNSYTEKIKAHQALMEARKQKMRAWMIFWINFSRVFIKTILNVTYAALFAIVAYCTIIYGIPFSIYVGKTLVWLIAAAWSVEWLSVFGSILWITGYAVAIVGTISSIFWIVYKIGKQSDVPFNWMWEKTLPSRALINDTFIAFNNYVVNAAKVIMDFVSLFYEENCPTITVANNVDEELK